MTRPTIQPPYFTWTQTTGGEEWVNVPSQQESYEESKNADDIKNVEILSPLNFAYVQ